MIRQFYLILWVAHIHSSEMRNVCDDDFARAVARLYCTMYTTLGWRLCIAAKPQCVRLRLQPRHSHVPMPSATTRTHILLFSLHISWFGEFTSTVLLLAQQLRATELIPFPMYSRYTNTAHSVILSTVDESKNDNLCHFLFSFLFSVARSLSLLISFPLLTDCSLLFSDFATSSFLTLSLMAIFAPV